MNVWQQLDEFLSDYQTEYGIRFGLEHSALIDWVCVLTPSRNIPPGTTWIHHAIGRMNAAREEAISGALKKAKEAIASYEDPTPTWEGVSEIRILPETDTFVFNIAGTVDFTFLPPADTGSRIVPNDPTRKVVSYNGLRLKEVKLLKEKEGGPELPTLNMHKRYRLQVVEPSDPRATLPKERSWQISLER